MDIFAHALTSSISAQNNVLRGYSCSIPVIITLFEGLCILGLPEIGAKPQRAPCSSTGGKIHVCRRVVNQI